MINLIPPHARKQVRIEYWVRVVSVWMFLFAAAAIIIALLLLPSWMLIQNQLGVYSSAYQTASDQNTKYESLEADVRNANEIARKLAQTDSSPLFTTLITDIESLASHKVTLQSISSQRNEKGIVEEIHVRGIADTRVSLVAFADSLKAHPAFASADLPLSNLAKDKEVPFDITIIVAQDNSQ